MSTQPDLLTLSTPPERLHFATGLLLAEEDFRAEQLYHRSRLARVLTYLHGAGTVAGLRVVVDPANPNADPSTEEMLTVQDGMAIDRLGRLLEVDRLRCLRLMRWYDNAPGELLNQAFHTDFLIRVEEGGTLTDITASGVVVDIFMRFVVCEQGKTPAFRTGPFDALDAVQPSRLRDGVELTLIPRIEAAPPLPLNLFPDLNAFGTAEERRVALNTFIFGAYPQDDSTDPNNPLPPGEHALGEDDSAVFLARLLIPAEAPLAEDDRPVRTADPVRVDNHSRLFAYPPRALARGFGL
jgi:hypothetical protein